MVPLSLLSLAALASTTHAAISVKSQPPSNAGIPLESFVSYSIEFSSFADYAGNKTHPNDFSYNLLNNLQHFAGTKPYIRVGGNTQDFALFNKGLPTAYEAKYDPSITSDFPVNLTIGPKYFESYQTWPGVKFIHGFNLGKDSPADKQLTLDSVAYVCKALGNNLLHWELGNEPDLYGRSNPLVPRPSSWDEKALVQQWLDGTRNIKKALTKACPSMTSNQRYTYHAPDFAGVEDSNGFNLSKTFIAGLDDDKDVAIITSHNYISGAETLGVTLQGTLMNHTRTVASVSEHLHEKKKLEFLPASVRPEGLPYIIGEGNSLYHQGRPGLSNTFGAALWGIDFNLYCAANNISRVHMHTGTNYRYGPWQPVDTDKEPKGTKAPYYGSVAVAAFLGKISSCVPKVVNLPLPNEEEAAYAAYENDRLARIILINMMGYNTTADNQYINKYPRPNEIYTLSLPDFKEGTVVGVQRLLANGSDAISGITFDGYSYNYELNNGKPVLLHNVTRGEELRVGKEGGVKVTVPRSSAVILSF